MRYRLPIAIFAICLLIAPSIASEREGAADDLRQSLLFLQGLDQRIADISWKLRESNIELCPNREGVIGVTLHDAAQYAPSYRAGVIEVFGFRGGLPAILAVAKGGPGDLAGLKVGDSISGINGELFSPTSPPPNEKEDYRRISAAMARLEHLAAGESITLDIVRDKQSSKVAVRSALACSGRVEVVPGGSLNASSDGFTVQIYGKLALWTRSDDELAIVIAHEMAHNILGHNQRIDRERIGTGLFSSLGSHGRKLRDMEREADRYGLYLAARAGYDYAIAADFWRRLSSTAGLGALWGTTHPSAGNRARFNEQVIMEIRTGRSVSPPPY